LEAKTIVDARGRSCPEPVILTRRAIVEEKLVDFEVIVDTAVAKENVERFCQNKGFTVEIVEVNGEYLLKARK